METSTDENIEEIIQKIKKPFDLEKQKGYSNTSVINGFDRYVMKWTKELAEKIQDSKFRPQSKTCLTRILQKVQEKFGNYTLAGPGKRAQIFEEVSRLIEEVERFFAYLKEHPEAIYPPWLESTTIHSAQEVYAPVQYLKGVGPGRAKILKRVGINTIYDLITYFPFRYEDRSHLSFIAQLKDGDLKTIQAIVKEQKIVRTRRGPLLKVILTDGTGDAIMFCFNQFYLKDVLVPGTTIVLTGRFVRRATPGGRSKKVEVSNFTYEVIRGREGGEKEEETIHTNRIVPIYPVTEKLNMRFLRSLIKHTLDEYLPLLPEYLPREISERHMFLDYQSAISNIHFPQDFQILEEARKRLAFDELFLLQLVIALEKRKIKQSSGITYSIPSEFLSEFEKLLPFSLTGAQRKVIGEILKDMAGPEPMNRLLQGDVGSGKTVVAVCAAYAAIKNGYQVAFMSPTEILAEQHFINLRTFFQTLGINSALLISSTGRKERERLFAGLSDGTIHIVIGTHALIEEGVNFHKLGFIIIDEQHKFGVMQRAMLRRKGINPDVLVMTATPIPRTLALTVYGDLDLSVIDEMPPGRKEIKTLLFSEKERSRVEEMIRGEVKSGRQAYIVYPLIEESEKIDLRSATKEFNRLKKVYPELRLGLMHGRLPSVQKESIMKDFKNGDIDILVSTTVIEVGIDIPNASIMLIEHPERFGLAQLHQLRGRIGRGEYESKCILLAGSTLTQEARERIEAFVQSMDGFKIAEQDLRLRGPGEFMGTRQHGMPNFKIADIIKDIRLLETAREEAFSLVEKDPLLSMSEHYILREAIKLLYRGREKLIKVA